MKKILVIEDNSYQVLVIDKILEKSGYESASCGNGNEGLVLVQSFKPDVIICDLVMPGMGGKEVVKSLMAKGDKTPVIVLSADIQDSTKEELKQLGVSFFLGKPIGRNELLDTLEKILNT